VSRFKLLLAVSADGFLAKGPDDDMRWTGAQDKFLFKLLTTAGDDRTMLVGHKTAAAMPAILPHRRLVPLSRDLRKGLNLDTAADRWPDAWLIGGPTVALAALQRGLVDRAYICRNIVSIFGGIPFAPLEEFLPERKIWLQDPVAENGVKLQVYWGLNDGT
jgi:dihydrofolate reductase